MGYREEGHSMHEVNLLGMLSLRNTLEDRGFWNRKQKLLERNHQHQAALDSEAFLPYGKWFHLASDACRVKKREYCPHCAVFLGLISRVMLIVVVRSRGGRSTATVCRASLWVWKVKTSYGLPPSKQKMVYMEIQGCHSVSNTWWGTGK